MAFFRNASFALLSVLFAAAFGCADDNDDDRSDGGLDTESDTQEAQCRQMISALCERACACSTGTDECQYFTSNFFANHTSEKGCLQYDSEEYCSGDFVTDFESCRLALESALCGEFRDKPGLQLPAECYDLATHMMQ